MLMSHTSEQAPGRIEVPVYPANIYVKNAIFEGSSFLSKAARSFDNLLSPARLADIASLASALGGSSATFSQPSSSGSSLASLDLEVPSGQSSTCDLHTPPGEDDVHVLDSFPSIISVQSDVPYIEEVLHDMCDFDSNQCKSLTPVKLRPPPGYKRWCPDEIAPPPSPPRLVPVYQNLRRSGTPANVPGLAIRPTRVLTNVLPGPGTANNLYDLSRHLAEFKNLRAETKSPVAGAKPPSPHFPSLADHYSNHQQRGAPTTRIPRLRSVPLIPADEPAALVLIPGTKRVTPAAQS